jgi:serine/threonine protein kinase/Tfp pilus assembly protein PilF
MPNSHLAARLQVPSNDKPADIHSEDGPFLTTYAAAPGGTEKPLTADDPNATLQLFVGRKPQQPTNGQLGLIDQKSQDYPPPQNNKDGYRSLPINSSPQGAHQFDPKEELPSEGGKPSAEQVVKKDSVIVVDLPFRKLMLNKSASNRFKVTELSEPEQQSTARLPEIPGYEVLAELGRGGMGVVYQGRHCFLKRLVALKMILAGPHANPKTRARFRTEAEAVARLQHPNIVQIYEVGECNGIPFLSLEYVDGGSLQRQVHGTAQPEHQAARLMETLARAVHHLHRRGIVHRDLKPTNILLTSDGIPKISDFGLAKVLDADIGLSRTDTLIGTPTYMAPEQAMGDAKNIGPSADVYSLGAIFYELLTGRAPFHGDTTLKTLELVRNHEPVPPSRLRRPLSLDLETICLKCLEKKPANRYASAEALADDCKRFSEGLPIQARPVPAHQRCLRSLRRHPALVACVVAVAAMLSLVLTLRWYSLAMTQLAHHQADKRYEQFVQSRNEALVYGLLASDDEALFLGSEADFNLKTAQSAAQEALALAGVDPDSDTVALALDIPASRKAAMKADCYILLLVLASTRGQQLQTQDAAKGSYRGALRILDRTRQLGIQTRAYHIRRAEFFERLGDLEQASKERNLAADHPLEGALDHFLAGEEQYRHGDWKKAGTLFNRALNLEPDHFWAQFLLAVCHLKSQQWEAARAGLNACLAHQSDFVWAYLFRSFAHERAHAISEAEADFRKALELNPNEDARYLLFLTRGVLHFNQKELDQAGSDFRSAMELKPKQYNAYLNLAHVCLSQEQFVEAAEQVKKAQQLGAPVQIVAGYYAECGRQLLRLKKYEEAFQSCETALELCPNQPLSHEVGALAQLALGHYEQAEKSFDSYLAKGGAEKLDVFRGRGLARMKLAKYPEAAEDYGRVLEQAPDDEIYQHRGWANYFSDAWKLALRDFSKAIELSPESGDAYTGRGLSQVMLGNYKAAVADAEAALIRHPRMPEMMHNIACIFAQAVGGVEKNQLEPDRQPLTASFRKRALAAVLETLSMVSPEERRSFWHAKILPDTALTSIRNEPEFKRLQEEYGGLH